MRSVCDFKPGCRKDVEHTETFVREQYPPEIDNDSEKTLDFEGLLSPYFTT